MAENLGSDTEDTNKCFLDLFKYRGLRFSDELFCKQDLVTSTNISQVTKQHQQQNFSFYFFPCWVSEREVC